MRTYRPLENRPSSNGQKIGLDFFSEDDGRTATGKMGQAQNSPAGAAEITLSDVWP